MEIEYFFIFKNCINLRRTVNTLSATFTIDTQCRWSYTAIRKSSLSDSKH